MWVKTGEDSCDGLVNLRNANRVYWQRDDFDSDLPHLYAVYADLMSGIKSMLALCSSREEADHMVDSIYGGLAEGEGTMSIQRLQDMFR